MITSKQGTEAQRRLRDQYSWAEASIWTDNMLTALVSGVKGGKWFSLIDKVFKTKTLNKAWKQVKSNKGAAGIDSITIERFEANQQIYLEELQQQLKDGTYQPQPVLRVEIPKPDGGKRPLGIPAVKNRIVQTAIKMVIEPIFESEFLDSSYGFRPGKSCHDALRRIEELLTEGYCHILDADISKYFDTIDHGILLKLLEKKISDSRIIGLIRAFLTQGVIKEEVFVESLLGSPQGGVLSPLLANIYLHEFDKVMDEYGIHLIRYADDFLILVSSQEEVEMALEITKEWMSGFHLSLHPEKTRICNLNNFKEECQFLGYIFYLSERGYYVHLIRRSSLMKIRNTIRYKTRRYGGKSPEEVIKSLNPTLRGWASYFKYASKPFLEGLDGFIRRRLRSLLRAQEKRPGFGMTHEDHTKWPNEFFAKSGLFTTESQHAAILDS